MNNIYATILKDSINPYNNKRFVSFEIQLPKVLLAEMNTHRALSKNFMSSRAIPNGSFLDIESFEPQYFRKNQSGMEASMELVDDIDAVRQEWEDLIGYCKAGSMRLSALGLHKQWTNRPNDWHVMAKGVLSGTDWENFKWLRDDTSAQPEFEVLAKCITAAMDASIPEMLVEGEYHVPYIKTERDDNGVLRYFDSSGEQLTFTEALKISTSCTAQVSYRRLNDSKEKALDIYERLFSGAKKHMSPTEHQGTPISTEGSVSPLNPSTWPEGITHVSRDLSLHSGNLSGWIQYRQTLPENVYMGDM
jgi:hypothetical protein